MKVERNVRQRRAAGKKWRPAALLLAAVLVLLSLPLAGRAVYAVDLTKPCSLTVTPGSVEFSEDLALANVVIDLYRVADAAEVPGYDTYSWNMTEPFQSITIDKDIDNAGWKAVAQQAAQIVLGDPAGKTGPWTPEIPAGITSGDFRKADNPAGTKIGELPPGLYLILAHGSDVPAYAKPGTENSPIVTIANSRLYQYSFEPELISLPAKAQDSREPSNTADVVDWIYDAAATLKPSREFRPGELEIEKTLLTYSAREKTNEGETRLIKDPATFIFEVSVYNTKAEYDAQGKNAPKVFHDMVSVVFDSYGTKSVKIGGLPADSYAVVEEIYKGGIYKATTGDVKNQTIVPNETVKVEFENDYDDKNNGGGSVTNKFKADGSKWGWQQVSDDSTEGSVIQSDEKAESAEQSQTGGQSQTGEQSQTEEQPEADGQAADDSQAADENQAGEE